MDGGGWNKVFFHGDRGEWNWGTKFDGANGAKPDASFKLSGGTHLLEISGRSTDTYVDKIHLNLGKHNTNAAASEAFTGGTTSDGSSGSTTSGQLTQISPIVSEKIGIGRTEAEDLQFDNYIVENRGSASGDQLARVALGSKSGELSGVFTGNTGTYDVTVGYLNESDGAADVFIFVDGISKKLNTTGGGNAFGVLQEQVFTFDIAKNDLIEIVTRNVTDDFGRIDYIDIDFI
jgi:hypothetical protein